MSREQIAAAALANKRVWNEKWALENPEKIRASASKYRDSHPATPEQLERRRIKDKARRAQGWKQSRKWAKKNPIKYRAAIKRWELANHDRLREARKKWNEANKDKRKEIARRYREKIAAKKRIIKAARDASEEACSLAAQAGTRHSPWSHLLRVLTQPEWEALKGWRKLNTDLRFKRGDTRSDGAIFLSYHRERKGGECWGTAAQLEDGNKRTAIQNLRLGANGYAKQKSKEGRARMKARGDPEELQKWKDYHRAYDTKWRTPARVRMYLPRKVPRAQARGHQHEGRDRKAVLALYQKAVDLSAQTGMQYVVDHIIPIKRGGWTHELNLQVMPAKDNFLKQAKAFWTSWEYLDFRDVPQFLWPEQLAPYYRIALRMLGRPLKTASEDI